MPETPRTADELRRAWHEFFSTRGHAVVPSASTIPIDKSLLFTVAGMVPFKSYFVGEETAPYSRASSIQKCVRAGGKHNDLEEIGRTNRHFSFFEMMGNFRFGDYFKRDAIRWAWEFYTEVLKFPAERLWVTVHVSDDEASDIWHTEIGVPLERIQRLDEDNFWKMGDTGPCGPCSEIFWDLGPSYGIEGGPATGADRYVEVWNLVFMQFDQQADGTKVPLPKPSIDTGAGLERNLLALQGVESVWDLDIFQALIAAAAKVTGIAYGVNDEHDVYLRILADHARMMTFVVSDGVMPSNQERGYVLRRIIRRAVRHAYQLGARDQITPSLVAAVCATMGVSYPKLLADQALITKIISHEEASFRATLARGTELLDEVLTKGDVSGADAFFLHDTLGFPVDLTKEIAAERGRDIDVAGYETLMFEQRDRARQAAKEAGGKANAPIELFREVIAVDGLTTFTGRDEYLTEGARVVAIIENSERVARAETGRVVDVILDRTPFYAESGGQVGDAGELVGPAVVTVTDTQLGLPGLTLHRCTVNEGSLAEGDIVDARIDGVRRDRIRRNHTATHILHWALRETLGDHVKQAGSHVSAERLRFDFSHFESVGVDELAVIEAMANSVVITGGSVTHDEMTKAEAEARGAIAFFGDKYGDVVRVLEAGPSTEFCGGTHVSNLGFIGPIKILSEGSIGSNVRRIEALTGDAALAHIAAEEAQLRRVSAQLKASPIELEDRVGKLLAQVKALEQELAALRTKAAQSVAVELAQHAVGSVLVLRHDGGTPDDLRQMAQSTLRAMPNGSGIVALIGIGGDGAKAALAVAVSKDFVALGASAAEIAAPGAKALGGGTAKSPDLVVGGGPNISGIDEALRVVGEGAQRWRQ